MQEDEVLKIAIAETSMIVRSGLALVLKRIQGLKILPIELVSEESLDECVRFHKPEILIEYIMLRAHIQRVVLHQQIKTQAFLSGRILEA